jgi:trk system potassium uptake protein TrkA
VAKVVFGVPKVVARIYNPEREQTYHQLGLDTVSTVKLGVASIRNLVTTNGLRHLSVLGSGEVELVQSRVSPALAGKTVAEAELSGSYRTIAVLHHGIARLAQPETVLAEGDVLVGALSHTSVGQVKALLGV